MPCDPDPCAIDSMTIHWTLDTNEYIDQFTVSIDYSLAALDVPLSTTTTFDPMDLHSSTVLPASFLPALRPGETSDIAVELHTGTPDGPTFYMFYTGVSLAAPLPTTVTVTETATKQVPTTVTVTATGTVDSGSPTPSEEPGEEGGFAIDEDNGVDGGSGGMSTGAKTGIGVGVSAGVLAIAAAGFWLLRRRRRDMEARHSIPVIRAPGPELDGIVGTRPLSELHGKSVVLPSITATVVEREHSARHEMGG
ncbi:hypothetical protein BJX65DRAFT_134403 [Aspergillus insuetus]